MQDVRGKVAVVTGAASGIGRALAERFAAEGMKVVLADIEQAALTRTVDALAARGATVRAVPTDVARSGGVEALAAETLNAFGAVHLLCNNAGVVTAGPTWELSVADWEWVLGVNLWGVIHGIRTFVPIMLRQDTECHIVNTASMAGLVSTPMNAPYNVSKHGVVTLSETLQHDLSLRGARIKVSVLCPGWVNTRIIESERNRPADLAAGASTPTPEQQAMEDTVRQLLATGLPPEQVAARVFAAIREERFYVLTHPEWKEMIRTRMEDILEERPPTLGGLA
jgi:NAD(P)-dependent dehydrogenase (short-subunit alcohol dehydrogenase family)